MAYLQPQGNIYRNYVLNSNFQFQQRGTGFISTPTVYNFDRWINSTGGTAATIATAATGLAGTSSFNCVRLTAAASGTLNMAIFSPNDSAHTADLIGKQVTFSFKARKSAGLVAGNITAGITTTTTVNDGALAQNAGSLAFSFATPNASIPTGDFQTFYGTGFIPSTARSICFSVGILGTPPTASQYLEITDIMVNVGAAPAPYQLCGQTLQGELNLLKAYYEVCGSAVGGTWTSATTVDLDIRYATEKRITPTVTLLTTTPSIGEAAVGNRVGVGSTIGAVGVFDTMGVTLQLTGFTGAVAQHGAASGTSRLVQVIAEIV